MKKAGDLLNAFFDRNFVEKANDYAKLFSAWEKIAGNHAAAHSRILELDKGILQIAVDHPGWIQVLQMDRENCLSKARLLFPQMEIHGMVFFLEKDRAYKPVDNAQDTSEKLAPPEEMPEKDYKTMQELYEKFDDPELQATFKRIGEKILPARKPR